MADHVVEGRDGRAGYAKSREDEATTALQRQGMGLAGASAIFALASLADSDVLRFAALMSFIALLAELLPVNGLNGARLFPGFNWPIVEAPVGVWRARLSKGLERAVRRFAGLAGLETAADPKPLAVLIGPALIAFISAGFGLVVLTALLLPPLFLATAVLIWVLATFAVVFAVAAIDPRRLEAHARARLAPRRERPVPATPTPTPASSWSSRSGAKAALVGYLVLVVASSLGALAAWSGMSA